MKEPPILTFIHRHTKLYHPIARAVYNFRK